MAIIRVRNTTINPLALAATLALGGAGGGIALALHLPLALLLGAMFAVALFALMGWRPLGQPIHLPQPLRMAFVPVIGVAIGGNFTPAVFENLVTWIPSLIALLVYVPLAHFCAYRIYRLGGLTPVTAYFGAVPGGLIESVVMGEEAGGDPATLVLIQFLRLILTIVAVPVGFMLLTGHQVGSGAGIASSTPAPVLSMIDAALLTAAGLIGYFGGKALRLPAAMMTGPLLASAALHLAGWTQGVPPGWAIGATQLVVGAGLGARFAGMDKRRLRRGFGLAVVATGTSLALAGMFAFGLNAAFELPLWGAFLAFAPGGITEMSLIALSLQISVVYVTAHHLLRIVLSITIARTFAHRIK